jgi:hypothetical protein
MMSRVLQRERDAYRRGAEAMREACAKYHDDCAAHAEEAGGQHDSWVEAHHEHSAKMIRALSLPPAS